MTMVPHRRCLRSLAFFARRKYATKFGAQHAYWSCIALARIWCPHVYRRSRLLKQLSNALQMRICVAVVPRLLDWVGSVWKNSPMTKVRPAVQHELGIAQVKVFTSCPPDHLAIKNEAAHALVVQHVQCRFRGQRSGSCTQ